MKIKISQIKDNPFREELGPYDEEQITRLIESYQTSDYGSDMRFEVRKNIEDNYELVYGHHRLLALKRYYGDDLEVEIVERNYRDMQMLRELLRENLIKSDGWQLKMRSLVLLRKHYYLFQTKKPTIRDLLRFISKDAQIISEDEARALLRIYENLAPELLEKVKNMENAFSEYKNSDYINLRQAKALSQFTDKREQFDLVKALKSSITQSSLEQMKLLTRYKSAPEETKRKIRLCEIDLAALKGEETPSREERQETHKQTEKAKATFSTNKQALYIYSCLSDAIKNIEKLNKKKLDRRTESSLEKIYRKTIVVLTAQIGKEVIDVVR